ncbi:MAG: hypothetical protein M3X11_21400 [Acidobacteriota bacterium]|nr:hypothetical protein [Acidobacteriota bacterium]
MSNFIFRSNRKTVVLTIIALSVITLSISALGRNWITPALSSQTNEVERIAEISKPEWPADILKLEKITNLRSEEFPKDFEIKIKNISKKPIYYLSLSVLLPEAKPYVGNEGGRFRLTYGDAKFKERNLHAESTDNSLQPEETYVLSLSEEKVNHFFSWVNRKSEFLRSGTKRLVLAIELINFGDGTGYTVGKNYTESSIKGDAAGYQNGKSNQIVVMNSKRAFCWQYTLYHGNDWCGQSEEAGACNHSSISWIGGGDYGTLTNITEACGCTSTYTYPCDPLENFSGRSVSYSPVLPANL